MKKRSRYRGGRSVGENTGNTMHSINGSYELLPAQGSIDLCVKRSNSYVNLDNADIEDSHIHDVYEIYINISGDVSFLYNSEVYKIEKGDIVFSAPGDIHHCIFHSSGIHDHYCIWFSLARDSCVAEYIKAKKLCGFVRLSGTDKERIINIAEKLEKKQSLCDFEKSLYFYNIIEQLSAKEMITVSKNETIPKQLADILEYIEKNFAQIRCVEEVASEFYMSVATLSRKFREHLALSPHKFLIAQRLSHAEKMLREGNTVIDACYACGFRDCSRFIECFKKRYGMTPLKYRNTVYIENGRGQTQRIQLTEEKYERNSF